MLAQKVDDKFIVVDASIEDFKVEMKKLGEVLVELTRQEGRQNLVDERVMAQGRRIDDINVTLRQMLVQQMRDGQSPAE